MHQQLIFWQEMASLREKCPSTEFFSGPYSPVCRLNTEKYGPEKTPYLDIFHALHVTRQRLANVKQKTF